MGLRQQEAARYDKFKLFDLEGASSSGDKHARSTTGANKGFRNAIPSACNCFDRYPTAGSPLGDNCDLSRCPHITARGSPYHRVCDDFRVGSAGLVLGIHAA
jgi:hypothetical protein